MEHAEVELNEKLAKWAGVLISIESWPDEEPTMYVYDTEQENLIGECSPFTESLDACFKWLVPKLVQVQLTCTGSYNSQATVFRSALVLPSSSEIHGEYTPALALCKAIEKLIDSTK